MKIFKLFWIYFKIGIVTVGGGLVMLPLIEREFVHNRKWIAEDEILDVFAISQSFPGIIAVNVAVYTGYKVSGFWGGIFAALGIITPSLIAVLGISAILPLFLDNIYIQRALSGATVGLAGMLLYAAFNLGKRGIKNWFSLALAAAAFAAAVFFGINVIYIILFGAVVGAAICRPRSKPPSATADTPFQKGAKNEEDAP